MGEARGVGLALFRRLACALLLALLAGCQSPAAQVPATPAASAPHPSGDQIDAAFEAHRSNVWVEGSGAVTRLLRDDTKRPRHQRFVVDVGHDHTILIAHNIDLAPRVPLARGDTLSFRGEYIWGEQGGTVHRTHGGPGGGGWIRLGDVVYR